jgi:hypothetical protein
MFVVGHFYVAFSVWYLAMKELTSIPPFILLFLVWFLLRRILQFIDLNTDFLRS